MKKLLRKLAYLLNRRQAERDMADEMSAHRDMMEDSRQRAFGPELRLREEARDAWGFTWVDQFCQDLRYGVRQLRRSPGFTLVAVIVLGLGVGLNLALYLAINSVFNSRIAQVLDSDELMRAVRQSPARSQFNFVPGAVEFYRQNSDAFEYIVSETAGSLNLKSELEPVDVRAQFVSPNYFSALKVPPAYGRLPGGADRGVVALGYGFWQRYFGADPKVVGSVVQLNDEPVQVIGVAAQEFDGLAPRRTDIWLPMDAESGLQFERASTAMFAKIKAGISQDVAEQQLRALAVRLRAQQPQVFDEGETIRIQPLADEASRIGPYAALGPLVFLVLICACANLGNMLLARGLARRREIDTRAAIGAGRWRVVRQLLTENLLLAGIGTIVGIGIGRVGARLQLSIEGSNARIVMDWTVIVAAAVLAIVSLLFFGLGPAMQAARGGRTGTLGRRILIGVQIAVSCVLLIFSGILVRSAKRLNDLGGKLDYSEFAIVDPELNGNGREQLDELAERLARLPGIDATTVMGGAPVFGLRIQGTPGLPPLFWQNADPEIFGTMRVRLTRGRLFEKNERDAVIISETAARVVFPDKDPLGRIWEPMRRTIVGVAQDSPAMEMVGMTAMEAYIPLGGEVPGSSVVVVRTRGDAGAYFQALRAAASTSDKSNVSVWGLQDRVEAVMAHGGMATEMIGSLGTVASFLAGLGIFGMVAFAVAERAREIGIRLALGAGRADVLKVLLGHYRWPLVTGIAAGIVLAAGGEWLFGRQMLLGLPAGGLVGDFDLAGYLLGLGALVLVVFGAVLVPARRALRIDPAESLRGD